MGNEIIKKTIRYIRDKDYRFFINATHNKYNDMPDDLFLKGLFKSRLGYELNLDKPRTFNEKIQWLKLYDRHPEYTKMVDKHLVKEYVSKKIGSQYIIPTIGIWDDPDIIDFDKLPDQFVLKCNHNSGKGLFICRDKNTIDIPVIKNRLQEALKEDYYLRNREWPYKNVQRKILAEEYISDGSDELRDYKLMCFNGKVKCTFVCSDRFSDDGLKVTFFDNDWKVMPFERHYPKVKSISLDLLYSPDYFL